MNGARMKVSIRGTAFDVICPTARAESFWKRLNDEGWEIETLDFLDQHVSKDTFVFDIGAWIGPVTLYASSRAGHVFAVEPDPAAYAQLQTNVTANAKNVTLYADAVGRDSGILTLYAKAELGDSETSALGVPTDQAITVTMITLKKLIEQAPFGAPVVIKMDVEGVEYQLVDELVDILVQRKCPLHLSVHPSIYYRSIKYQYSSLRARLRTFRQTWFLLARLRPLGSLCLVGGGGGDGRVSQLMRLVSWVFFRSRVKNFVIILVPDCSAG